MRRGKSSSRQRLLLWILSIVIVTSMICSFAVSLAPPRAPQATATPETVTAPVSIRATDTLVLASTPEPSTAEPPEAQATPTP